MKKNKMKKRRVIQEPVRFEVACAPFLTWRVDRCFYLQKVPAEQPWDLTQPNCHCLRGHCLGLCVSVLGFLPKRVRSATLWEFYFVISSGFFPGQRTKGFVKKILRSTG